MAGRRSFAPVTRKRRVSWHGSSIDIADLVVGTDQLVTIIPEATLEAFPNPTIVRVRGNLLVLQDSTTTAGAFGHVTMGIIKVTAAALAGGSVPSPLTDVGNDWLWWADAQIGEESSSSVIGRAISVERLKVDSKAMRKVGLNEALIFVATITLCEGTTVSANICGALRMLLKAP